jgi:hypothetical protein
MLSGQALTDHAAAVAGAAAGVAAATALRDPLTRILDAASGAASTAASETPRTKPTKPAAKPAGGAQSQPSGAPAMATAKDSPAPAVAPQSGWRRRAASAPMLSVGQPSFNRYESAEPMALVTTAQLRSVTAGASSGQVIESLGIPAARITMEDSGHLVEILEYNANGSRVGSVRCADDRVESVDTADR